LSIFYFFVNVWSNDTLYFNYPSLYKKWFHYFCCI
jgi:hypothetical protein